MKEKPFLSPAIGKLNLKEFAHEKYRETIGEIDDIDHEPEFEQRMKKAYIY